MKTDREVKEGDQTTLNLVRLRVYEFEIYSTYSCKQLSVIYDI